MIKLHEVSIQYDEELIHPCDLLFEDGKFILIKGKSGSGKTSLLYRIGLISTSSNFDYLVNNQLVEQDEEKEKLRKLNFGYVLQESSLFPQYDVIGNMQLYAALAGYEYSENEYQQILSSVHLAISLHQEIETLSGGERQRLAIACALCKKPDVLILDEITSSLDRENEENIFHILLELAHHDHKCVILASHSRYASEYADKIYQIDQKEIACIKDKAECISVLWKQEEKPLTFRFYKEYIMYFLKKYKKLNLMIMITMCLALFLCQLALGIFQIYADSSDNDFSKLYEKQLFVTNSYGVNHMDDILTVFEPKSQEVLDDLDSSFKEYPMISVQIVLEGEPIWILPYFESNDFSDKISESFADDGLLMSEGAYDLCKNHIENQMISTDINLYEFKEKGQSMHHTKQNYQIKGVLKSNVLSPYLRNKNFIYMKYSDMEQLYHQYADSDIFIGKTLVFQNYQDLQKAIIILDETSIGVNKEFCDVEMILTILQNISLIKTICIVLLLVTFAVMFSAFQVNYLYKRNTEFALLITNGMRKANLMALLLLEMIAKFLITMGIASLLMLVTTLVIWYTLHRILFSVSSFLLVLFAGLLVSIVMTGIYSKIYLNKLTPESILRD